MVVAGDVPAAAVSNGAAGRHHHRHAPPPLSLPKVQVEEGSAGAPLRENFPGYPTTLNGPTLTGTEEILTFAVCKSICRIPVAGASAMSRDPTKKLDQVAQWLAHIASHCTLSPYLIGSLCLLTLLLIAVDC